MLMNTNLSIRAPQMIDDRGYVATVYSADQPLVSLLPVPDRNASVVNATWMVSHLARGVLHTLASIR